MSNENTKTMGIIYRNNDSFELFVPKIIEVLEDRGYTINVAIVPRDTDVITVDGYELVEDLGNKLKGVSKNWISDITCNRIIRIGDWNNNGDTGSLDHIVGNCVSAAFLGVDPAKAYDHLREQSNSLDMAKAVFQKAIVAAGEKIGAPSVVNVEPDNLNDHEPFITFERNPWKEIRMSISEAVGHVQSWVREIYPDCKFDCARKKKQATWKIGDRHSLKFAEYEVCNNRVGDGDSQLSFRLPVENMLLDLAQFDLLPPVRVMTEHMVDFLKELLPK